MSVVHHSNETATCLSCEKKLQGAYPYMAAWFRKIKVLFPDAHISWAWRGKADQEACFNAGTSAVHWPNSSHNRVNIEGHPESYALDLFQLIDGKAVFDPIFYAKVNAYNTAHKEPIFWGQVWISLGDACHFQFDSKPKPAGATFLLAVA